MGKNVGGRFKYDYKDCVLAVIMLKGMNNTANETMQQDEQGKMVDEILKKALIQFILFSILIF